jgi:hypothetical protein
MNKLKLIFYFLLSSFFANAQNQTGGCIDSTRIQPGQGFCTTNFEPVCGCNNVTYNNDCIAISQGLTSYLPGPCEPIAANFFPNPLTTNTLSLDVILRNPDLGVTVFITDLFGKYYYYQKFNGFNRQIVTINAGTFEGGMYLVVLQNNNFSLTKKIVVPVLR